MHYDSGVPHQARDAQKGKVAFDRTSFPSIWSFHSANQGEMSSAVQRVAGRIHEVIGASALRTTTLVYDAGGRYSWSFSSSAFQFVLA